MFKVLFESIDPILEKEAKEEASRRDSGEYFNIFKILGMSTKEVKTHTPFLAELLSPRGTHFMGTAPLDSFLSVIGRKGFLDSSQVIIKREYSIGAIDDKADKGGQIDLIIEAGSKAILIENKINAEDQYKQLRRYYKYAKETYTDGFLLLYLTLDRHNASDESICSDDGDKLRIGIDYELISYKDEIIRWLTECLALAENRPVMRESIRQYLILIKQLTYTMNESITQSIVELMIKHPREVAALQKNMDAYINYVINNHLKQELESFEYRVEFDERYLGTMSFIIPEWNNFIVKITSEGSRYYIGITWKNSILDVSPFKLSVFQFNPNKDWNPFGSSWLPEPYDYLCSGEAAEAILNGGFSKDICPIIRSIVKEANEKIPRIGCL